MFTFLSLTFSFHYTKICWNKGYCFIKVIRVWARVHGYQCIYHGLLVESKRGPFTYFICTGCCLVTSRVCFVILWTVAHHVHLHRFPREQYWSGLPFPSLGDLRRSGIESMSPTLAGRLLTTEPLGKPSFYLHCLSSNQKWYSKT